MQNCSLDRGEIEILPNGQILYDAKNKFDELAEGSTQQSLLPTQ